MIRLSGIMLRLTSLTSRSASSRTFCCSSLIAPASKPLLRTSKPQRIREVDPGRSSSQSLPSGTLWIIPECSQIQTCLCYGRGVEQQGCGQHGCCQVFPGRKPHTHDKHGTVSSTPRAMGLDYKGSQQHAIQTIGTLSHQPLMHTLPSMLPT